MLYYLNGTLTLPFVASKSPCLLPTVSKCNHLVQTPYHIQIQHLQKHGREFFRTLDFNIYNCKIFLFIYVYYNLYMYIIMGYISMETAILYEFSLSFLLLTHDHYCFITVYFFRHIVSIVQISIFIVSTLYGGSCFVSYVPDYCPPKEKESFFKR